jgi:hypothetical protein
MLNLSMQLDIDGKMDPHATRSLMCHTTDLNHHFALIHIIYVPRDLGRYTHPMLNISILLYLHCQTPITRPFQRFGLKKENPTSK